MEETKRRRFIIRAVLEGEVDVQEEPQPGQGLVTDGLLTYFDMRSVSYNNSAPGGKTIIYSSDGNYSTYAWAVNGVASQDPDYGITFGNSRTNQIATQLDGTTDYQTGDEWSEVIMSYNVIPKSVSGYIHTVSITGTGFSTPYTKTGGSHTNTATTGTEIGYRNNQQTYLPLIARASGNKFDVFDKTGSLVYSGLSTDIADFESWKTRIGFGNQTNQGSILFYATYTKALTDAEIQQMLAYLRTYEV